MNALPEALLRHPGLWQGKARHDRHAYVSTGFTALDEQLPGNGWPRGALSECLVTRPGIGELQLLLPALVHLAGEGRWMVWIAPPYIPYAPALGAAELNLAHMLVVNTADETEALWAAEQALHGGVCSAVLLWSTVSDVRPLRRLQLAAEESRSWAVLCRSKDFSRYSSPAALRLALEVMDGRLAVQILKCRGSVPTAPVIVEV